MTTGTDEFSLYTRTDSYFSPSVKDGSIFTDPEKHKEFAFAKTYGDRLYELFNAEESAVTMFNHYGKAPIYTMKIACGNNPKLVEKNGLYVRLYPRHLDSFCYRHPNSYDSRLSGRFFRQSRRAGTDGTNTGLSG